MCGRFRRLAAWPGLLACQRLPRQAPVGSPGTAARRSGPDLSRTWGCALLGKCTTCQAAVALTKGSSCPVVHVQVGGACCS